MARSSTKDPVEKFRFKVSVLSVDASLTGAVETIAAFSAPNNDLKKLAILSRAGFSEVQLPKVNITEISYRENIDNQRFSKIPGLVKYDPVTLRRGVTRSRDFYDWYRLVNEELALTSVAQELNQDAKYTPVQSENFRKDMIIEVMDRSGQTVKAWYLFNCWPISYKPGNDLSASSEEKLIEELTLTYEYFLETEVKQGENVGSAIARELAKGVVLTGVSAVLNKALPFLR